MRCFPLVVTPHALISREEVLTIDRRTSGEKITDVISGNAFPRIEADARRSGGIAGASSHEINPVEPWLSERMFCTMNSCGVGYRGQYLYHCQLKLSTQ